MNRRPSTDWSPRITFSATVNGGTRRKCWCTIPIPASRASRGEPNVTGLPPRKIWPSSGWYSPVRIFESVDLPAPFSPSRAWTSPGRASKSTWSLASTPGKRLVIPRMATAGTCPAVTTSALMATGSAAFRAADDPLHEPVDRVQIAHAQLRAGWDLDCAGLVLQRTLEFVEASALERLHLGVDLRLHRLRHGAPIGGEADHPVGDAAVVVVRLPAAIHRGFHPLGVVGSPVINGSGQPDVGSVGRLVRVISAPGDIDGLGGVAGGRAVLSLADRVHAQREQALRGLLLFGRVEPGVGPNDLNGGTRVGGLGAQGDGVDLADDFRDGERRHKADLALLTGRSQRHPGQVIGILRGAEVLAHVGGRFGASRLLEFDVGVLLRLRVHRILKAEGRAENDLVAVSDQVFNHLGDLRSFRHVFLVGGLHRAAQLLL